MKITRMSLVVMVVMAALCIGLMGCPQKVGVGLIVSPETLDFGADKDEAVLRVYKTFSSSVMEPLVVSADEDWLLPQHCTDSSDNCVSGGPRDAIRIPVRIDRNKLTLGLNAGTLRLHGNSASPKRVQVVVDERVQADFSAREQTVSFGRSVEFLDMSRAAEGAGVIERWLWNFGDGSISTLRNPFHLYRAPGLYDVSLTITTSRGISRMITKAAFIRVKGIAGEVDFVASRTNVGVNEEVVFTDLSNIENTPILARAWAFGDGGTSTALTPRHRYGAPGIYSVTLTVTTATGDISRTKENYIVVRTSEGPTANFVYDTGVQANPYADEIVQFFDLSLPGSAPITSWDWDFGDGNVSSAQNPTHRYTEKGTYTVALTVTTQAGTDTKSEVVPITYRPPIADFDAQPRRQFVGEPITFYDRSEPGHSEIVRWLWSFGDGNFSAARNPVHSYRETGVYTVKLEVTGGDPDGRWDEIEKIDFIRVIEGPTPDFSWTPRLAIVNQLVTFDASASVRADESITLYRWNFGDGTVGQGVTRTHRYTEAGRYPVTLTLRTATGEISLTKEIVIDRPPTASFTAQPLTGMAHVDEIAFTVNAQPPGARPITSYFWEFGDGSVSNVAAPRHIYERGGVFTVRLTARYRHSQAVAGDPDLVVHSERVDYITITDLTTPFVRIAADRSSAYTGETVTYRIVEEISPEDAPIQHYIWDLGDGVTRENSTPDPVAHQYTTPGLYDVSLTVVAPDLPEAFRYYTATLEKPITIIEELELDRYISFDDGCFDYTTPIEQEISLLGQVVARAYLISTFTSQCWNPDEAVHEDHIEWVHPIVIYDPVYKTGDSAMLFIDGGSRSSSPAIETALWQIAVMAGTPLVHVKNIPSQPIVFLDEVIPPGEEDNFSGEPFVLRRRTEDAAIAYSYDRYLTSWRDTGGNPTPEWPLLFPMAKAAVKAMDLAMEVLGEQGTDVADFVVTGASKRGWTTWLAGAADARVRAIAPIVINVLNMSDHLAHHRAAYGYWSPAIYDYAQMGIFDQLLPGAGVETISPEALALLEQVDPYEYALKGRYPMPKFLLNATGDEFFVPDTAEFYFHDLEPDKHMAYVPNVGHGMGGLESAGLTDPTNPAGMLLAWYMAVTQGISLPQVNYSFEPDGSIVVESDTTPTVARLWQATSVGVRDFRDPIIGAAWTDTVLEPQADGSYVGSVTPPANEGDYTAFFIQMEFPNPAQVPAAIAPALQILGLSVPGMSFSTGVRVLPEEYPEFTGYVANVERPDAVLFDEDKMPVIVVYGSPYEMGYYYGQLLADEINAFIPAYISAYLNETGLTAAFLQNAWAHDVATLDPRLLEEMVGIADAPGVMVTLQEIQYAHAAAMRERLRNWTATTTVAYRELIPGADGVHGVTINGPMARGLHSHQCAILYIPDEGVPHAVFTYAGLTFGRTGINLSAISAVEVPDPDGGDLFDPQRRNGSPYIRSILYDALSLRQAVGMLRTNAPRRRTTLVLSDGRNELRGARIRLTSAGVIEEERYDLAWNDLALGRRGLIADSEPLLRTQLYTRVFQYIQASAPSGRLTLNNMRAITAETPFARPDRNLLNVVYDAAGYRLQVNVAAAQDQLEARQDIYEVLDMQRLLP